MGTLMEILWEFPYGNPVGIPIWESHGNSHVGILWESCGNSHGNPMGILTWESCGNSHRKPVGMGWEWELKFHSHGNPVKGGNCPQKFISTCSQNYDIRNYHCDVHPVLSLKGARANCLIVRKLVRLW